MQMIVKEKKEKVENFKTWLFLCKTHDGVLKELIQIKIQMEKYT